MPKFGYFLTFGLIQVDPPYMPFQCMKMPASEFYQQHLNRVSRSFAFCIAQLDLPLKTWVGLTYLTCRVLDTIEDAAWKDKDLQKLQFKDFDRFIQQSPSPEELLRWSERFPKDIPAGEKKLILDSGRIFGDVNEETSQAVKTIIRKLGLRMSAGMQYFASANPSGELKLNTLSEVNQYCFFVAGLVGEALARLLAQIEPKFRLAEQRILEAHHFGLFLQKVNLLKDQKKDEKEGRYLVPERSELLASTKENLQGAFKFLSQVPESQENFKLFCAWSLFLGLATLANTEKGQRLARGQTEKLLLEVQANIENSEILESMLIKMSTDLKLDVSGWRSSSLTPVDELSSLEHLQLNLA